MSADTPPARDPFRDRVAVVTGGAAGIGLAMAKAFQQRGARLVLADVDEAALGRSVEALGGAAAGVLGVVSDVRERKQVQELAERSIDHFGGVHLVCNNAGIALAGPLSQAGEAQWRTSFDINFWGVVHGVESFLPHLLERGDGHIVNTASMAGLTGMLGMGIYCATKFAVVGYTESLERELGPLGIGVHLLCPMIVETGIGENSRRMLGAPPDPAAVPAGKLPAGFGSVISPARVAARVVGAVESGEFYILTHPEQREILRRRSGRLDSAAETAEGGT